MSDTIISDQLLGAFADGFESIAKRYPGSGTKAKVRLVRKILGLTQQEFSDEFGIPFATVRNWELPERGDPTGAAKAFIDILSEDPNVVRDLARRARKRDRTKATNTS